MKQGHRTFLGWLMIFYGVATPLVMWVITINGFLHPDEASLLYIIFFHITLAFILLLLFLTYKNIKLIIEGVKFIRNKNIKYSPVFWLSLQLLFLTVGHYYDYPYNNEVKYIILLCTIIWIGYLYLTISLLAYKPNKKI